MFAAAAKRIPHFAVAIAAAKLHWLGVAVAGLATAVAVALVVLAGQAGWTTASAQLATANGGIEQARAHSRYESTADSSSAVNLELSQRYTALTAFDAFSAVMAVTLGFAIGLPLLLAAALMLGTAAVRLVGQAGSGYRRASRLPSS